MLRLKTHGSRITFRDGFSVSIKAGSALYCKPRDNHGPYTEVEMGFPSGFDSVLADYIEGYDTPFTQSVFPYVPFRIVDELIRDHGSIIDGVLPPRA